MIFTAERTASEAGAKLLAGKVLTVTRARSRHNYTHAPSKVPARSSGYTVGMKREKTSREQKLHKAAIDKIVADWMDGKITLDEKRQRIHEENIYFHGVPMAPAHVSRETELVLATSHYRPDPEPTEYWWQK